MKDSKHLDIQAAKEDIGRRLDLVAADLLECSRSMAASAIGMGNVLVNGKKQRPSYCLRSGDWISGTLVFPELSRHLEPVAMPLDILFEDNHILIVNKPVGMVVHPGAGNWSHTLVNALLAYAPEIALVGEDPLRPGIVHRLDKDTSGVLVVAKTCQALSFLQKEFSCRRVKKWYLAMVWGRGLPDTGEINLPIGRHKFHRKRMAVDHDSGREARTSWQVIRRFADMCLVRIRLYTGRTHQIRVHFHALGYPLVGDPVYGFRKKTFMKQSSFQHQMLHSWKLVFRHPYSGRQMESTVPVPEQWRSVMADMTDCTPKV